MKKHDRLYRQAYRELFENGDRRAARHLALQALQAAYEHHRTNNLPTPNGGICCRAFALIKLIDEQELQVSQ